MEYIYFHYIGYNYSSDLTDSTAQFKNKLNARLELSAMQVKTKTSSKKI
jgi:hypothetical protein